MLSKDQISFFKKKGYLAIDTITTPEDVVFLRQSYDRIFAKRAGREEGNQFDLGGRDENEKEAVLPQIMEPAKYAPEINDSLLLKNATIIAKQLLGKDGECSFFHAIFKPPRTGAVTPWHQDASYWNPDFIHNEISIWVPLQEAKVENGCMQFIPKSQELDVLKHRSINNDPRIHGLELHPDEMDKVKNPVACPIPAGGATVHGGYMLHYTGPNETDIPRRALILSGKGKPKPRKVNRRFKWLEERETARMEKAKKSC